MEETVLRDLGAILIGASVVVLIGRTVGVPSIIAYLIAGLVLGPGLGVVPESPAVELISESGIVLLLFLVGLELSVAKLGALGTVPIAVGGLQVPIAAIAIAAISLGFDLPAADAVFLGVALTFSSTVVTVSLLDRMGSLDALHGRISVGVLLVQDLLILLVLTVVAGLGSSGGSVEVLALARALGGMVTLALIVTVASRWVLPAVFSWAASSQEILLLGSLAWCFSLVLGAEAMGLSPEIGAFMAGVSLAQLPYSGDLRRRVHPLMSFFIAVFFVSLGIHMEIGPAIEQWVLVLVLTVFSLALKPLLVARIACWRGVEPRSAMRTGLDLGHTSEFSVVLGALALDGGLVSGELLSVVAAVGLLTMGLSAVPITYSERLVDEFERRRLLRWLTGRPPSGRETLVDEPAPEAPGGHIVVVGMNALGRDIVQSLADAGERTLAVDTDPMKLRGLPCKTLLGNVEYLAVLERAGLAKAKLLVSALRIEDVNRLLAYRAATHGVPAVIHAYDRSGEAELLALGVSHLLDSRAAGVDEITRELNAHGVFRP